MLAARPHALLGLFLLGLCAACGGARRTGDSVSRESLLPTLHVNAATGSDAASGAATAPLRTISRALAILLLEEGGTVVVAPGDYDAKHGESFPLYVPNNVALLGDAENRGLGDPATSIVGFGQVPFWPPGNNATVRLGDDATISGFYVSKGGSPGHGINIVANDRARIEACTIEGPGAQTADSESTTGIFAAHTSGCAIRYCVLENHRSGIQVEGTSGPGNLLESNVLRNNRTGILVWINVPPDGLDLGGGSGGSLGLNVIAGNEIDLLVHGGTQLSARNNAWDHVPPEIVFEPDDRSVGMDIYVTLLIEGTAIDTAGATLASP